MSWFSDARCLNIHMTATPQHLTLLTLLCRVDEARAELMSVRGAAEPRKANVAAAQKKLLSALEVYAAVAETRRIPVPHRLRVELVVYRNLQHEN